MVSRLKPGVGFTEEDVWQTLATTRLSNKAGKRRRIRMEFLLVIVVQILIPGVRCVQDQGEDCMADEPHEARENFRNARAHAPSVRSAECGTQCDRLPLPSPGPRIICR